MGDASIKIVTKFSITSFIIKQIAGQKSPPFYQLAVKNMKAIVTIIFFISSFTSFAQAEKVVGNYTLRLENKETHLLEYNLTLNPDGTFFFHYYSNIKSGIPPEKNKYGKGNWTIANNVVSFFADKQKDFDDKHTLDFTNTKARLIIKSPRNKTDQIIKTKLQFLASDIFWMKRIDLFKV